jgi:hypothetical protein
LADTYLVSAYIDAVKELAAEGNKEAKVICDALYGYAHEGINRAITDPFDSTNWAYNIHNNERLFWCTNSFGSTLKARVVLNRLKRSIEE